MELTSKLIWRSFIIQEVGDLKHTANPAKDFLVLAKLNTRLEPNRTCSPQSRTSVKAWKHRANTQDSCEQKSADLAFRWFYTKGAMFFVF